MSYASKLERIWLISYSEFNPDSQENEVRWDFISSSDVLAKDYEVMIATYTEREWGRIGNRMAILAPKDGFDNMEDALRFLLKIVREETFGAHNIPGDADVRVVKLEDVDLRELRKELEDEKKEKE